MILHRIAGIIGTRRALQLKAIITLTKHVAEGSEHRFYRLGQFAYYSERFELEQAIPDKPSRKYDTAGIVHYDNTYRLRHPDYFKQGYSTGGPVRRLYQDEAE
ncbi:hypothetical protein [Kocuria sp. TGY1127_2]|uniref:hypothetical protein n=1 Tax=Kocuria sp. TGY1127_2 TaxID=2711328 RepID=UPI0015BECCDA|nr:hypothetical protein [Kocuria sp. TGY1127_2]